MAVSPSPMQRRVLPKVALPNGWLGFLPDGKTSGLSALRAAALLRMVRAGVLRGTRCAAPSFMRSAGIVHKAWSRSISLHVARRASVERWQSELGTVCKV